MQAQLRFQYLTYRYVEQRRLWQVCICRLARAFTVRIHKVGIPGRVAQSVTCLVTDAKLTADPGVASLIPARSHTFVEIDDEIISTVILLPSAESFMKGCCQLQAKVCARLLVNCEADCRSRGREFDPSPVPYFRGD